MLNRWLNCHLEVKELDMIMLNNYAQQILSKTVQFSIVPRLSLQNHHCCRTFVRIKAMCLASHFLETIQYSFWFTGSILLSCKVEMFFVKFRIIHGGKMFTHNTYDVYAGRITKQNFILKGLKIVYDDQSFGLSKRNLLSVIWVRWNAKTFWLHRFGYYFISVLSQMKRCR